MKKLNRSSIFTQISSFFVFALIAIELGACGKHSDTDNSAPLDPSNTHKTSLTSEYQFYTLGKLDLGITPEHKKVISYFNSDSVIVVPPNVPFKRGAKVPKNINLPTLEITYLSEGLNFAEKEHRIFRDISPNDLPRDHSYNFVIFASGEVSFSMIANVWEYGSKHLQLAQGKPVLAAGEFSIDQAGQYQFNILSGSIALPIIHKYPDYQPRLESSVTYYFRDATGTKGTLINKSLVPQNSPSLEEQTALCAEHQFNENNSSLCLEVSKSN
jgi:hypothetical protein